MCWTCEGNPGITHPNYWTVWAIVRETGQIIVYIASRGHCSEVHVGCVESVAGKSSVIVLFIGCMPGLSPKTQKEKPPFHFRFEEWAPFFRSCLGLSVCIPFS